MPGQKIDRVAGLPAPARPQRLVHPAERRDLHAAQYADAIGHCRPAHAQPDDAAARSSSSAAAALASPMRTVVGAGRGGDERTLVEQVDGAGDALGRLHAGVGHQLGEPVAHPCLLGADDRHRRVVGTPDLGVDVDERAAAFGAGRPAPDGVEDGEHPRAAGRRAARAPSARNACQARARRTRHSATSASFEPNLS